MPPARHGQLQGGRQNLTNREARSLNSATQQDFDALAPTYRAIELHKRSPETDRFLRWVRPRPEGWALDIASGPAVIAKSLARLSKRVLAFDMSLGMLDSGRLQADLPSNLLLVRGKAERLPFADGSFDLITCAYSFANFRRPLRVLREATRVLLPFGRVALIEVMASEDRLQRRRLNQLEALRSRFFTHIRSYSQYVTLFRRAGLKLESSELHDSPQSASDWVRLSPEAAKPDQATQLGKLLRTALGNDEAGVRADPTHSDGFYYQTAWFLFRLAFPH